MKGYKCQCGALYWGFALPEKCYVCKSDISKSREVELIDWEYELITNNKPPTSQ